MKRSYKIPVLTCSLFLAISQPTWAQSSQTGSNTTTGTGNTGSTKGTDSGTGSNRDSGTRTSVGNNTDVSGGTTNTGSTRSNPKVAKDSRHCAANEEYVKQGDRMVCVPRATDDSGQSAVKDQGKQPSDGNGKDRP